MKKRSLQLGLCVSVGIITGSLVGIVPFYRLIFLAIGIGILVGVLNGFVTRSEKE